MRRMTRRCRHALILRQFIEPQVITLAWNSQTAKPTMALPPAAATCGQVSLKRRLRTA